LEASVWSYPAYDGRIYIYFTPEEDIRFLVYYRTESYGGLEIGNISISDRYDKVLKKFGNPDTVSISKDNLTRITSYKKYNVFFEFEKNKVTSLGVYNQKYGPIEYKEYRSPSPTGAHNQCLNPVLLK
jgi:hypothetical protein